MSEKIYNLLFKLLSEQYEIKIDYRIVNESEVLNG